jgi:hypothetical protein
VADDEVELIAVGDEEAAVVGGDVGGLAGDLDAAEGEADETARGLVVVAGDENDACAVLGLLEDAVDDAVVGLGPVPALLEAPHVDDVADQVEGVAVDAFDEASGLAGAGAAGAHVEVADEDGAETGFDGHACSFAVVVPEA